MKNILIYIVLGILISSCTQSKYANLDSQFANKSNNLINEKYNNKNCVTSEKRKKQLVRQLAIATQE